VVFYNYFRSTFYLCFFSVKNTQNKFNKFGYFRFCVLFCLIGFWFWISDFSSAVAFLLLFRCSIFYLLSCYPVVLLSGSVIGCISSILLLGWARGIFVRLFQVLILFRLVLSCFGCFAICFCFGCFVLLLFLGVFVGYFVCFAGLGLLAVSFWLCYSLIVALWFSSRFSLLN